MIVPLILVRQRLPGYIEGSEWKYIDTATFTGVTAGGLSVTAKAAGGARIKNVITHVEWSFYNGATASSWFIYLINGAAPQTAANSRWFFQRNAPVNSSETQSQPIDPSNPLVFDLNSAVTVVNNGAGVAGSALQIAILGYQIRA